MKTKLLLFATLLLSGICIAQSNPTRFTNSYLPNPEPQSNTFNFLITTEDYPKPLGACPANSGGCRIYVSSPYGVAITLPDIPNRYVNHDTITCTITNIVVSGTYGCQGLGCQSVTYTATGENDGDYGDAPCKDADGRKWTIRTTQYYHWRRSGRSYFQHYDGGSGTLSHY